MDFNLWLLLIAGLASGISQIVNKHLSFTKHQSTTYTTVVMLMNALISLPLFFYAFKISYNPYYWLLIIVSVAFFAIGSSLIFRAYKHSEVSFVTIVQRLNIVFTVGFGVVIFKEDYSLESFLGLGLILISSTLLVYKNFNFRMNQGFVFALLASFMAAVASGLDKFILKEFSPFTYVFINNLFSGLLFLPRKNSLMEARGLIHDKFLPIFISAICTTVSFTIIMIVLQRTNISLTFPVYKSLSFLTPVILGITMLGERQNLARKILATMFGLLGILLLYWH